MPKKVKSYCIGAIHTLFQSPLLFFDSWPTGRRCGRAVDWVFWLAYLLVWGFSVPLTALQAGGSKSQQCQAAEKAALAAMWPWARALSYWVRCALRVEAAELRPSSRNTEQLSALDPTCTKVRPVRFAPEWSETWKSQQYFHRRLKYIRWPLNS